MHAKKRKIIFRIISFALCLAILIITPVLIAANSSVPEENESAMTVLTVWQIDSFEGGKGSRASYLQTVGNECFKNSNAYLNVISLTASAARQNIAMGITPDLVSYGAGTFGLENIICGEIPYFTWAHGGYCILTTDENADFGDINYNNTVINIGIDNLSGAAALFCGLEKAAIEKPTSAYVSLIQGRYKYLLGTQRDIYRLRTRQANFKIKPVSAFNDLYQNISITTPDSKKALMSKEFVDFLLDQGEKVAKLGLMTNGKYHNDELSDLEQIEYDYKLIGPMNEMTHIELENAIGNSNINLVKNLLK